MLKAIKYLTIFSVMFFGALMHSASVRAAPLCLSIQPGVSPQCIYYDVARCFDDANRMGATCTGNVDFIQAQMSARFVGPGQFCLTDVSSFVSCIYQTQEQCLEDISRANTGVCVNKDNASGTLTFAETQRVKEEQSILSGIDSLGAAPEISPHSPSFDLLKPFDLNVNNNGSLLDLNE